MKLYAYDPDNVERGIKICSSFIEVPEGWEFTNTLQDAKQVLSEKIYENIDYLENTIRDLYELAEGVKNMEDE